MQSDTLRLDPPWTSILALAASVVLAILPEPATAQPPAPRWSDPHLPGAVSVVPAWLKDAPFDVAEFFAMPPAAENAAPLYLDAFFEFAPQVAHCFHPDRRGRADAVKDRFERFRALYESWSKDPKSVPAERIDAVLAEFKDGFRKLDLAQQRPRCVFAIGLTLDSPLSHAQVARTAAQALRLEASRLLDRGEVRRPIDNVGKMLRISRDLRPRGAAICQLVSVAIDGLVRVSIEAFLGHPRIKAEQCDALLRLLAEHRARAIDPFKAGIKGEYVVVRSTFRAVHQGIRTTLEAQGRPVDAKLDRAGTARLLGELLFAFDHEGALPEGEDLRKIEDPDFQGRMARLVDLFGLEAAQDRQSADEFTRTLLEAGPTHAARVEALDRMITAHIRGKPATIFRLCCTDFRSHTLSTARDEVYLGAAESLIAVRRWQLTNAGATPTDLAESCRASALPGVPLDPFSGSPLKLTVIDGEPVIYSVGDDGRDDRALKDADLGRKPGTEGDYLFRFKAGK